MNRRRFAGLFGRAAIGGVLAPRMLAATDSVPSLAMAAAERGLVYGANSDVDISRQPAPYQTCFREQCHLFAPGFLSWSWVSPQPGKLDLGRERDNLAFADRWSLKITGAHLLWQNRTPDWFRAIEVPRAAEAAMTSHVTEMATMLRGRVYSWNVVNEAIDPENGRPDGLRTGGPFLERLGPRFFDLPFHAARAADPGALLVYNENTLEAPMHRHEARRRAVIRLLDGLLGRNVPIDAVGVQAHLKLEDPFEPEIFRRFLGEVADRGVRILITELDVHDQFAPADIAIRDRLVAERYSQFLDAALSERAVAAIVTWGLSDRYTWLGPNYKASYGRPDGLPCRPLPFDENFRPKPAFAAILAALRAAPSRLPGAPGRGT